MNLNQKLLSSLNANRRLKVAVAVAADHDVLSSIQKALQANLIEAILVGNQTAIADMADDMDFDLENCTILHEVDPVLACEKAVKLVSSHQADFLMKGLVDTSVILKAVLNKEWGLRTTRVLSHVALFSVDHIDRWMIITDGAMNIAPNVDEKRQIIENAVSILHHLGNPCPKVALLAAIEKVNPRMQATLDAQALTSMTWQDCQVDGPFALDNAVSVEAAHHKGIQNANAGLADILMVPDIEAGNILYKSVTFLGNAQVASVIAGAQVPIVLTSRADSDESKYNSILLALALIQKEKRHA